MRSFVFIMNNLMIRDGLWHGCTNHAIGGETLQSLIHCCDVMKLPTCSVANHVLRPCTVNACLYTPCGVGGQSMLLCAQNTWIRCHTDIVGDSSGGSYITEQWHNVPLLRIRGLWYLGINILSYSWGKTPRKNLNQENKPDQRLNLGMLAEWHLDRSCGHRIIMKALT